MSQNYIEHTRKAVEKNEQFSHVMAITLDPRTGNKEGIIRCITSREGNVEVKGYVDRSELHRLHGDTLEHFTIGARLSMRNEQEILRSLTPEGWECIGLEDPDIWIDAATSLMHVYFTIPIKPPTKDNKIKIHLGHAIGRDLDSLEMTTPVLADNGTLSAKEISITPLNKKGFRYNLVESRDRQPEATYSTVQVAIAENMGSGWRYGETAFHPKDCGLEWIAGHASPGPLFPKSFIDIGEGKMLGVINGREANQKIGEEIKYGIFSVGLFVYDYENGKIDWVSPEPFIRDSEARTITFASQFVDIGNGKGILYAHVDDSFVRAYTLSAEDLKKMLPELMK